MHRNGRFNYKLGRLCLSDSELTLLEALAQRNPHVRQKLCELRRILLDPLLPIQAKERHLLAIMGAKTLLGRERELNVLAVSRLFGTPFSAAQVAEMLAKIRKGLRAYYQDQGCIRTTEIQVGEGGFQVTFTDHTVTIFVPDPENRNRRPQDEGLCPGLADLLADELKAYSGVRVSRDGAGATSGPKFRLPGHLVLLGETVRVGVTVCCQPQESSAIDDFCCDGSEDDLIALASKIASRVISAVKPYVRVRLARGKLIESDATLWTESRPQS